MQVHGSARVLLRRTGAVRVVRWLASLIVIVAGGVRIPRAGAQGNLPDLVVMGEAAQPTIEVRTFLADDCEVVEGCTQPGTRRLLRFNTQTANLGTADLVMGNPTNNPLFEYSPCHNHYHFHGFTAYRLLDYNSQLVTVGNKGAFCLEDVVKITSIANPDRKYSCDFQGIQMGWADVYSANLPCQYIDITGVSPGNYILEMEADPNHLIPELNENNNISQINITIPADCSTRPINDTFPSGSVITTNPACMTGLNFCCTKQTGEPAHAGNAGGHSLWFRFTPQSTAPVRLTTEGSDFDTLLAVYRGTDVSRLTLVANNDDIAVPDNKCSRVTFTPAAGITYYIAVDGYAGAVGRVVLNLNPPLNDDFTDCEQISGTSGTVSGYNIGASKERMEPTHARNIGGHSVWFCWTAPISGPFEFNTAGSSFDTTLGIYHGSSVSTLTEDASDNDADGNLQSRLVFEATAGAAYQIAIDGFSGATGNYQLNWNEAFRLAVQRTGRQVNLSLIGAPGRYQVLGSDDLKTWAPVTIVFMTTSPATFSDTSAGSHSNRFYRAMVAP
jgi:Lysyl oxidase